MAGPHELRDVEARHAFQVLRKRVGDELDIVDGQGKWFKACVTEITKRACTVEARLVKEESERAAWNTTLLVAPTKNIDRFEWILEKCTEIGVDAIQPIYCDHSERRKVRLDRLERVLEAAMKQSLRAWLPELYEPLPLEEALVQTDSLAQGYLAYLGEEKAPLLRDVAEPGGRIYLAIGPEGGFSQAEAELAKSSGYQYVSLGPNRLRTETAAITAVHTIEQLNW